MQLSSRGQTFFILLVSLVFLVNFEDRSILFALILFLFITSRRRSVEFDIGDILIFAMPFYTQMVFGSGLADALFTGLGCVLFYQLGKSVGDRVKAVIIPAAILAIKGVLGYTYIFRFGRNFAQVMWPGWNDEMMPRTHHESWMVLIAVLLIYFIIITVKRNYYGIIGIAASVCAIGVAVYGRGGLAFILSIGTAAITLAGMAIKGGILRKKNTRIAAIVILALFAVAAIIFTAKVHNDRFIVMGQQIALTFSSPFGATDSAVLYNIEGAETTAVPNSWLQAGRQGGIIALILACTFTGFNIYWLVKVWAGDDTITKYAPIAAFIGITLLNMFEPCILNNGTFWYLMIYLGGMIRSMYNGISEENRS